MSRLRQLARIGCLARRTVQSELQSTAAPQQAPQFWGLFSLQSRGFAASSDSNPQRSLSVDGEKDSLATDLEQATGLEREEVEGKAKGIDIFHEDWLDAPFGTAEAPVEVPSAFSERVVGVPDPDDDSIIWWGAIKEGEGPKQIVEGGEYFVLKKVAGAAHHH